MTPKQRKFCEYYLKTGNATQSAIKAGYAKKTAYSSGQRMLKNVVIFSYLQKRGSKSEKNMIADADEVLAYLTRVMRREEHEHIVVTVKKHKSSYDQNGKKMIADEEEAEVVPIPSKLTDSNRAAEMLAKRYRLFTDNAESDEEDIEAERSEVADEQKHED